MKEQKLTRKKKHLNALSEQVFLQADNFLGQEPYKLLWRKGIIVDLWV